MTAATSAIASRKGELRGLKENRDGKADRDGAGHPRRCHRPGRRVVQADGDHGDYSFEQQARSGGLVLGRKIYEGLAGYWPGQTGEKALIDEYEVYLNPLVWGQRLYSALPDAGAAERADERSDESIVRLCAVSVCREISVGRNAMKIAVYVLGDRGRYGWRSTM